MVAIARLEDGQDCVLPQKVMAPDELPLVKVDALIRHAKEAPIDHLMVLATQISAMTAQDLLFGPTLRAFPGLKVALSEGGIGWVPYLLERIDGTWERHRWYQNVVKDVRPSELFRKHIYGCFIDDVFGLKNRHDIGIDIIAWECDYPHSDSSWPNAPEELAEVTEGVPATVGERHEDRRDLAGHRPSRLRGVARHRTPFRRFPLG